jgi:pimeloyl-ACP methyl ester carboxylesterase
VNRPDATAVEPDVRTPLARFHGERPPAPAWFDAAMAAEPESRHIEVRGVSIEVLTWGRRGDPGILLAHGRHAHAGWWRHIAPGLADRFRVAAFSFSGAGRSGWRTAYALDDHAAEIYGVATAAGLFEAGPPLMAAHSMGGLPMVRLAAHRGGEIGRLMLIDSRILPPDQAPPLPVLRGARPYATLAEALARFRLGPPQPVNHPFLADAVAREGLVKNAVDGTWSWRFDPESFAFTGAEPWSNLAQVGCPLEIVYGDRSTIVTQAVIAAQTAQVPAGARFTCIPDAWHHLPLDQPFALAALLRAAASRAAGHPEALP